MPTKRMNCTANVSVSQMYNGNSYTDAAHMIVGNGAASGDLYYIHLNFQTLSAAGVPSGATVTAARLVVKNTQQSIGYNTAWNAVARRITSSWNENTTWSSRPSSTDPSPAKSMGTGRTTTVTFNITDIAKSWQSGSTQYGVRLNVQTEGTANRLKTIATRSMSGAPYIEVDYSLSPSFNAPSPTAAGTIKTDSKSFSWGDATDANGAVARGDIYYNFQISTNGGSSWGTQYTSAKGATSLSVNLRSYLGLSAGQAYYATNFRFRVRATGGGATGPWGTSGNFTVDYRLRPSAPSISTLSSASPYEGSEISITVNRPSTYNTLTQSGATNNMDYILVLGSGQILARADNIPVTTASYVFANILAPSITSGTSNLSTSLSVYAIDAINQTSPNSANRSITINRFRNPIIGSSNIVRSDTSATVKVTVRDTGYGGTQSDTQLGTLQYSTNGTTWTNVGGSWSNRSKTFVITGITETTRQTVQMRVYNNAPSGTTLVPKLSAVFKDDIYQYGPQVFVFRKPSTGETGTIIKGLGIGTDYLGTVTEGDATTQGKIISRSNGWVPDNSEAIDLRNSDIFATNGIFFGDVSSSGGEGLNWMKSSSNSGSRNYEDYHNMRVNGSGNLYIDNNIIHGTDRSRLWTGSWNSGTITLRDGWDAYKIFAISTNVSPSLYAICFRDDTRITGGNINHDTASTAHFSVGIVITFSGNELTYVAASSMGHTASGSHAGRVNRPITEIRGII